VLRLRVPDIVGEARPVLHHLGLIGGGGKRARRPTSDELQRLFAWFAARPQIGPPMEAIIRLAITIGLRRGEIFRIEWRDVDAAGKMLLVRDRKDPRKKAGNDQWVPLIGESFALINAQPRRDGEARIFPWNVTTCSMYFTRACKALAIPDLHFHDCRHEAASALIEAGWSSAEVRLITGHKSSAMLDRYVNLDPADLHEKVVPIGKAQKTG
jgi:integrase